MRLWIICLVTKSTYYFSTLENQKPDKNFFKATLKKMARETVEVYVYYTFLLVT